MYGQQKNFLVLVSIKKKLLQNLLTLKEKENYN